jgi:aspartyl aminopeptidase
MAATKKLSRELLEQAQRYALGTFLPGLHASCTQFHTVKYCKERLEGAGFEELKERDDWKDKIRPGKGYYLTRNHSTIVAFNIN